MGQSEDCYTELGFKAIGEVVHVVRGSDRVATFLLTTFWRNDKKSYSANNYVIGFDQNDDRLHHISMWLKDKMLPEDALSEAVAINVDCLEIEASQPDKAEVTEAAIQIAKYIASLHARGKPTEYLLFTYSQECLSLEQMQSLSAMVKDSPSIQSSSVSAQCWETYLYNVPQSQLTGFCIEQSYRTLGQKL